MGVNPENRQNKKVKKHFVPSEYHLNYLRTLKPEVSFRSGEDPHGWQKKLRSRLEKILGGFPARASLKAETVDKKNFPGYIRERIIFQSEPFADVPAYLLTPTKINPPFPVVICLQGHSPGMHISIGQTRNKEEEELVAGDRDLAIQAVENNYAALVIEQRCFGERQETKQKAKAPQGCLDAAMHSLLLGKTLIGERVWDVIRGIDYLKTRKEIDGRRIACAGNSGGGTVTFFAACVDERIKVAVPSCYYCSYHDSLMQIYHCTDNYLPGILKVADMGDLGGLIAPRPLIILAGETDPIFPITGVKRAFRQTKKIYQAFKADQQLHLLVGKEGHRFYAKLAWPKIRKFL